MPRQDGDFAEMLRLYTFGGLRIERDGAALQLPTHKARCLLAYLLAFRDRSHPRSVLAGTLWPKLSEEKARRRLSDTLWRVRRVLGDYVGTDDVHLWFNTDLPHWLDVQELERGMAQARDENHLSCLSLLSSCVQLYCGPFLDGFYQDWVLLERERLRVLYLAALRRLLEMYKQAVDYPAALRIAQRLVAVEPLHEAAHRELMRLYHLLGRDAEAIAQYHQCREILQKELDVAPAPETEGLYQILSRRVSLPSDVQTMHLPTPARRAVFTLEELPLVGRDAERAVLLNHLEAAAGGRGGIFLLEGEAGIGKTRLANELVAGARWRNVSSVVASASRSDGGSYALLLAALTPALTPLRIRQLARLMEPAQLEALLPLLPSIAQAWRDVGQPDTASFADLPPPQARERLQRALVALVLSLAHIAPHLWVLEDLQWADGETLALLPLLLPHLAKSRALFLLTGRSAELRANPAAWKVLQALDRAGAFPRCTLTRLDADAVRDVVRHLLTEDDAPLAEHLAQASEGVPLYIVETLKAWRDEGDLLLDEEKGWRWRSGVPAAPPSHLGAAVIPHRLYHLSPQAKSVLEAASVIGTEVDLDLLTRVCAPFISASTASAPYLLAASDELLRQGFLVETDVGYRISHERTRQAVYRQLSPTWRHRLHRRVAQAAEELYPEQFELLAHHFVAASEREPAIYYLNRAAGRARGLFAHQSALVCYDRLLALLDHSDDRLARYEALRARAEVLGWIGDREAQGRDLDEMLHLALALSDDARVARALHLRSEWHRLQGRYQSAEEDALSALEIHRQLGDDRARAELLAQLGWNVVYTANSSRAADFFQEALLVYRSLNDFEGQINCLSGLTAAAELEGDYFLALSYLKENMALAEITGDPRRIGRAFHNTGVIYYDLGDMDAAQVHLQQALRHKETIGDRRSQALTHFYLGVVSTEKDNLETAQDQLHTALEIIREVQDASWEGDILSALGWLALLQGDPVTASEHLRTSYQRRRELGEPAYAVGDLSYLALAELGMGDAGAAWEHSRKALGDLEADRLEVEHSQRVYYNHFQVAEATQRWAAARDALEAAARIVAERAGRIGDPTLRETYRTGRRVNRAIADALAAQPPTGRLRVRLARADVPAHRRPSLDETVVVIWTVDAGKADAALAEREGKVALRRHRILRLMAEAKTAGASSTVADLAGALDVSLRTIRADLSTLRRQGHAVPTRGRRT